MTAYDSDLETYKRRERYKSVIEVVKSSTDVKLLLDIYNLDYKSTRGDTSFRMVCPIHLNADRKDGFLFDNGTKSYKCFTKGCHGDVIQFVQEMDHCTFNEAVKKLADINNIDIENWSDADVYRNKYERFVEDVMEFGKMLHERTNELSDGGNIIRDVNELNHYVRLIVWCSEDSRRGLTEEMIDEFDVRLGRMEEDPYKHLRIIVPIYDEYGNYIGQVGRTWYDVDRGKYWYMPAGLAKSAFVFNGNRAKEHVMDFDSTVATMFLCEGTFDVLKFHKVGIFSAVAIFGSDPSVDQMRIIGKFCDRAVLCFDDDKAGVKGTKRFNSLVIENNLDVEVKVLCVSVGKKDVGEMSGYEIKKALGNLMDYDEWLARLEGRLDLTN